MSFVKQNLVSSVRLMRLDFILSLHFNFHSCLINGNQFFRNTLIPLKLSAAFGKTV